MKTIRSNRGFTLVEVSIILLVLVILSSIMLPQLGNFNRLARFVKVKEDLGAICSVMKKMLDEVMLGAFYGEPGWRKVPIGLLVGPGVTPPAMGQGTDHWQLSIGDTFSERTDIRHSSVTFTVDALEQHLQENNPLDKHHPGPMDRYKNPVDNPERWAAGAFFGWRGPYLDELTADPWGNRYGANVFALHAPRGGHGGHGGSGGYGGYGDDRRGGGHGGYGNKSDGFSSAVVCLSAGPDGSVETTFNQPMNDADEDDFFGWLTSGDDLAVVLSAGGPF